MTAIRAVSVSCPKINHNHLDPTHGYKETVRDLRFSQRCRWRSKTAAGLPDPEDKSTIILWKVRNYLPVDMGLTYNKILQFQRNHLSFKMDNISGSRSNSQIPLFSVIHYDAAEGVPLLILQASPFFLVFVSWSKWYTVSQNSNPLIFMGTCVGMCIICLLFRAQDSNHKRIKNGITKNTNVSINTNAPTNMTALLENWQTIRRK